VDVVGSNLDLQRLSKILAKAASRFVTGIHWGRQGFGRGVYWSYVTKRMAFSEMGLSYIFHFEASCAYT